MKREAFLWLLSTTAGATPLVGYGQGSDFNYPGLRFGLDRKFRITMLNDLHLGDGARPGTDEKTIGVVSSVLDNEPGTNLVVLNGDLTSCEWLAPAGVNGILDKLLDPLIGRKVPFATVFGNHDMSTTCDTRSMSEYIGFRANKGVTTDGKQLSWTMSSVTGDSEEVGTSNFYIPVYGMGGGGNPDLKMILWFFDSRGGRRYQPGGADVPVDDWVGHKVISWFTLTRDQIQASYGHKLIPSLAFVHIPPSVTLKFQSSNQYKASTEPGLNEETLATQADHTEGADIPFLTALVETKGLMAVFSGHDHAVDWCMKYSATNPITGATPPTGNNMNICFGRHTGYGGYSDWMRGGRHIVIDEELLGQNILETWIRLEDGSISGHVTLNETFGLDHYPFVDKKKSSNYDSGGGSGESAASSITEAGMQTQTQPSGLGKSSMTSVTSIASKTVVSPTVTSLSITSTESSTITTPNTVAVSSTITESTAIVAATTNTASSATTEPTANMGHTTTTASDTTIESTASIDLTQARHTANVPHTQSNGIAPKQPARI